MIGIPNLTSWIESMRKELHPIKFMISAVGFSHKLTNCSGSMCTGEVGFRTGYSSFKMNARGIQVACLGQWQEPLPDILSNNVGITRLFWLGWATQLWFMEQATQPWVLSRARKMNTENIREHKKEKKK